MTFCAHGLLRYQFTEHLPMLTVLLVFTLGRTEGGIGAGVRYNKLKRGAKYYE